MTTEYTGPPIRDLVDLVEQIEKGNHPPLPPLDTTDPYFKSLNYEMDRFGPKGKREVITGATRSRMIPRGNQVLINEDYLHMYCS